MSKTPRNDVLTSTIKVHIPVDLNSPESVQEATSKAKGLLKDANDIGQATAVTRFTRITALQPKFGADDD